MKTISQMQDALFIRGQEASFWEKHHHMPSEKELSSFISQNTDNVWSRWRMMLADKQRRKSHWTRQKSGARAAMV